MQLLFLPLRDCVCDLFQILHRLFPPQKIWNNKKSIGDTEPVLRAQSMAGCWASMLFYCRASPLSSVSLQSCNRFTGWNQGLLGNWKSVLSSTSQSHPFKISPHPCKSKQTLGFLRACTQVALFLSLSVVIFMSPPSFFHFFLFPSLLTRRLKVGSPSCLHLLRNCQLLTICVSARLSHRPRISGRLPWGCFGMWWHVAFRLCVPCDGLLVRQQQSGIKLLVT